MTWDERMWWLTLVSGVLAAILSVTTSVLDHRQVVRPDAKSRFVMHLVSYALMSLSIICFVIRGLISPA